MAFPSRVTPLVVCAILIARTLWPHVATAQSPAIEQSRLFERTGVNKPGITPDGIPVPEGGLIESSDDSFGAQQVLKEQERVREWVATGDASVFFTSNAALTRRGTISDSFEVVDGSLSWAPRISRQFELQMGVRASIFQYNDTSELDFENLGAGVGLGWAPPGAWGISFFGRYDFTELLDTHSREILSDHEWTLGAQKTFALGRAHALTVGAVGMAGVSDPFSAQRDQVGGFVGYHIQLTRQIDADLLYRSGYYFYTQGDRRDWNGVFSANIRYRINQWTSVAAFLSWGDNRSNHSVFDYDVFTGGGGLGFLLRF